MPEGQYCGAQPESIPPVVTLTAEESKTKNNSEMQEDSELMESASELIAGLTPRLEHRFERDIPQSAQCNVPECQGGFCVLPEQARGLHHSLNGDLRNLEDDMKELTKDLIELRRCVTSSRNLAQGP